MIQYFIYFHHLCPVLEHLFCQRIESLKFQIDTQLYNDRHADYSCTNFKTLKLQSLEILESFCKYASSFIGKTCRGKSLIYIFMNWAPLCYIVKISVSCYISLENVLFILHSKGYTGRHQRHGNENSRFWTITKVLKTKQEVQPALVQNTCQIKQAELLKAFCVSAPSYSFKKMN